MPPFSQQMRKKNVDAIVLRYGLCSNGNIGLSSKKYKIVVPRTDDCIALVLGSYNEYKAYFNKALRHILVHALLDRERSEPYIAQFEAPFTQGNGTENSPYGVSTPEQLNAVRYFPDAHFIMLKIMI